MISPASDYSIMRKRKRLSTLAEVTVGTAQECQDKTKRKIKPTYRFGTNVALKGRQHLYATESRTYQKNRELLMVPASKTVPAIPTFPPTLCAVLQAPSQRSALHADPNSAVIDAAGHPANLAADIALAMSAAP